ncbi:hypothetical protein GH714_038812 [Hevea brasiliensis]|uniref:Protein kinase domain-containing protein n=1 Tax=Hevea brasiliensis TaxID=3981 RepID=A0A6A6MSP9_HEVBR|nr:hypothetical protein GH714_038812 [Hevea brasiliensis]
MQELEKHVEPNLADYDKRTALHLASCEGCTEIVVLLLEKGADVNSVDRWGRTPLSDARSFGHEDICKILESRGGIDPVGLDSQTPCYEIDYNEVGMDGATLIGEGAYGEVYLVKWRGTEVAAKTIRSSIASNQKVKHTFLKELGLWQKLRHPNIVQFLGVLKHSDRLIFLTEYLRNGSLYDILKKKGRLDSQTAVSYALDIARGMNYLHQHKPHAIIHRDLTPRNVLQDESGHLKVTDFGLSKIAQEKDAGYKMTGGTGSYRYMAPEVYRRESYGKSVDVFSFALIVHEAELPEQVADKRLMKIPVHPYPQFCTLNQSRCADFIPIWVLQFSQKGIQDGSDEGQVNGFYMRCVELARKAIGYTSPNPIVGCVIVKNGRLLVKGFTPKLFSLRLR